MLVKPLRTELFDHSYLGISLQNAKDQLKITDIEEDQILAEYICASTERLERWLDMNFLFGRNVSYFPNCSRHCSTGYVICSRPFLLVEKFEYLQDGVYVELPSTEYVLQKTSLDTRICPNEKLDIDRDVADPVVITYILGFNKILNQTSMVFAGGTVTVVTDPAHGLGDNDQVYVTGADQPEYNGIFDITIIDDTSFSYQVSGTPAQPTGTIIIYGSDVPNLLKISIKQMVAAMYANRGDCSDACGDIPCKVRKLAGSFKKRIIRTTRDLYGCTC